MATNPSDDTGAKRISIQYEDIPITAVAGERLLDAILEAGIDHRHLCGGNGFCTSCRVEVIKGGENLTAVSLLEQERLGPQAGTLRLSCQTHIQGDVEIRVPKPTGGFSLESLEREEQGFQ
ncbi:MAG: hypothetical protein DLM70_00990 [Chloroflexi bacterium]|nr:MAG: hypothetical protein DLM70_00990 [Chloroflexota bacterium]